MRKYADKYLETDPWRIVEQGFSAERGRVSESLFAQANEHLGVRAYFEEGYSGDRLVGAYLNGVWEERLSEGSAYKGISRRLCFMVNTLDWLYWRVTVEGEQLDLATSRFRDFRRELDFRTGLLTRSFVWTTSAGHEIAVRLERFLSMEHRECSWQRLSLRRLSAKPAQVRLRAGLDFTPSHEAYSTNYWTCPRSEYLGGGAIILGRSIGTGQRVCAAFRLGDTLGLGREEKPGDRFIGRDQVVDLASDQELRLERVNVVYSPRAEAMDDQAVVFNTRAILDRQVLPGFERVLAENRRYWDRVWEVADIELEGDPENQQGLRFGIFQLEQTFRGRIPGANIGAKGLSGEAYNGNAFWDTEVYCLPYYLYTWPEAARALIDFRHGTLAQAKARARDLDCQGACFPVATIDGTESCTLWQHASLQFQPTTAVAYAVRNYWLATGDRDYLFGTGLELLVEICRFLVSRAQYSPRKKAWGFYAVMGPDEFQMMVNHNAYTNYMAKRSLEFTLETLDMLGREDPGRLVALMAKCAVQPGETATWSEVAAGMYIPRDPDSLVIEQHEGFFDLPHLDIGSIPPEDFPLYHSWSYDRIYRNDMIKQPDVLMFMFLYNQSFSLEEKRENYLYYEPRCIHESSLSPSVHSILATELGRDEEAFNLFGFATRIDLDNWNRNTREGLHLTSISAAWMNMIYGFGGLRTDGGKPVLDPVLPAQWQSWAFRLCWRGSRVRVEMRAGRVILQHQEGPALDLVLGGKDLSLPAGGRLEVAVAVRDRAAPARDGRALGVTR